MPLFNITLQHQLDQKSRDLIVQQVTAILASQNAALLQKVLAMSETVTEAVASLNAATQDLQAKAQAYVAAKESGDATISSLQSELAAAQAGDPAIVTAIDAATAAVGQVSATLTPPAPEAQPDPERPIDPNQPQG